MELAGGADALLAHARAAFDRGDYRWVAEVVNHLVFADPKNTEARALQADALEQLGYQSESATFRNAYLFGAQELRHGHPPRHPAISRGLVRLLPVDQMLAVAAMRLKADEVGGVSAALNVTFTDNGEPAADAAVTTDRETLSAIFAGDLPLDDAVAQGRVVVVGDLAALRQLTDHLDVFMGGFPIVEP